MEDKKDLNNYRNHQIIKYQINEGFIESINLALAGAALDETIISLAALINTGVVAIDILKLIKEEIIYFFNNHYKQDISKKSLELKILYNKYIKELSNYLKEKNIENPISIGIHFTNMLWKGNLSYLDNFEFKNNYPRTNINISILGAEVVKGEGVCRHIASLLVDIYKYLGYETELLLAKQYNKNVEDKLRTLLTPINHAVALVKVDGKNIIIDPTNKCIVLINKDKNKASKVIDMKGNIINMNYKFSATIEDGIASDIKDDYFIQESDNLVVDEIDIENLSIASDNDEQFKEKNKQLMKQIYEIRKD